MTCDRREADLLLLAHGELSGRRLGSVRAHLRRCLRCQARYARLCEISAALSDTLREPGAVRWSPASLKKSALPDPRLLLVLLIFLIGLAGYAAMHQKPAPNASGAAPSRPADSDGCAPNLPSDKCR